MKNPNILVTGAAGFIGSHLVEELVKRDYNVIAFVRYNSRQDIGYLKMIPDKMKEKVKIIVGDLRDYNSIRSAVCGMDGILHLGAYIAIPYSYVNPREVIENNIISTLNILMAAREEGTKRIIHTSTSEVYGTAKKLPITEEHPLQAQSPYSASKISADKIAESFYCSYDLPITIVRPFNTYGPRQTARAIIPTIISQALTSGVVRLGSINTKRDFTFIDDTVYGFIRALETNEAIGETLNLGTGKTISMEEIALKIFKIIGKKPRIQIDKDRIRPLKSEVACLQSSYKKMRKLTGWEPITDIDDGLRITIKWISDNIDLYRPREYAL